ncbi:MAG: ribosomal protein methylthiotransferase, partial [Pseudonocardiales bacterium]|nr:ribosomal protein methylthiotransferase [Pseudonocardiales bacterium]
MSPTSRTVSLVTLGCARNEVDSEELAGRLGAGGWTLTDGADADIVVINTCGFIDSAKKDSIDTVLAAADTGKKVVAVGCLAERYGDELAASLPEANAVLGFDSYADIAARLDDIAAGRTVEAHTPRDRRTLLPVAPAQRPAAVAELALPGHAWLPSGVARTRLDNSPVAYLKLASGCDRRCTFCAIPSFRGSFVSRPPAEVLAEAQWLASTGARELVLVSENSTSYGKDLSDLRALEQLLPRLAAVDGVDRIRVSYLQPAELRPSLLEAIATTPGVAPYFDLSFQHASPAVLRRMKRFGSTESFLDILQRVRERVPDAGARSNVIVGFPGETEEDVAELERFLIEARLDLIGVFGYSDEEGTEAMRLPGKHDQAEIDARVRRITDLVEELTAQRAEERIGDRVEVLLTEDLSAEEGAGVWLGHAAHQDPDADGTTTIAGVPEGAVAGELVTATVVD